MAARQVYSSESLAVSTTTSASAQTKNTLTFTPDASSNYLLLHSLCHGNFTNTLNPVTAKLRNTTASTDLAVSFRTAYATDNYMPFGGIVRYQSGASPVSTSFAHQYFASNAGDSCRIRDSRIIALKMGANDKYVESLTGSTNGTVIQVMKAQLMWTETAGTGDYLVIASAEVSSDNGSSAINIQLSHNMVNYGTSIIDPMLSSDYMGWACMGVWNVANMTTPSWDINYASINTNTAAIRNARIVALRLSDFDASYSDEDRTRNTTANQTSYVDKFSFTPATYNLNHLILGNAIPDSNTQAATSTNYAQFLAGSTVVGEAITRPAVNRNYASPLFFAMHAAVTSGTVYKFQQKTSASKTLGMDEQAIVLLQTAAGSADTIADPSAASLGMAFPAPAISAGASAITPAGSLGMTAPTPVVSAGANAITPAASMAMSFPVPSLSVVTPGIGTPIGLLLILTQAIIDIGATAAPLAMSFPPPAVATDSAVVVPAATLSIAAPLPFIASGASAAAPSVSLSISSPAPSVAAGASANAPAGSLAMTSPAPAVSMTDGAAANAPAVNLSINAPAPNVAAGASAKPSAGTASMTFPPVGVSVATASIVLEAPAKALEIAFPAPSTSLTDTLPKIVAPPSKRISMGLMAPVVSAGVNAYIPAANMGMSFPAPAVSPQPNSIAAPRKLLSLAFSVPVVQVIDLIMAARFRRDKGVNTTKTKVVHGQAIKRIDSTKIRTVLNAAMVWIKNGDRSMTCYENKPAHKAAGDTLDIRVSYLNEDLTVAYTVAAILQTSITDAAGVSHPEMLTGTQSVSANRAYVWITGGVSGQTYKLFIRASMTTGQILTETVDVKID